MMGTEAFRPLRDLRALLHNGMVGQSAAIGIFNILEDKPIIAAPIPSSRSGLSPTLEFDSVVFHYPNSENAAHKDVSFNVNAGERVGGVGASGSGKSTILKLLLRLLPNPSVLT